MVPVLRVMVVVVVVVEYMIYYVCVCGGGVRIMKIEESEQLYICPCMI
jgi:hypothetical protein